MRNSILLALLVVVPAIARSASAQATPATPVPVSALPSITLPPDVDRVLRDYENAWKAGDAAALAAIFAEDGFVLQGGRAPVRGRAAIQAAYGGQGGAALKLRALAYAAADTVGYIIGAYRYGDATSDMGKFTLTLRRKRGGPWMIFSDMDNMSQPPRRSGPG